MKHIHLIFIFSFLSLSMFGQTKKPTLMVVPGDTWCAQNNYMSSYDMQGRTINIPDYERALQEDMDLINVITKIGELMADRGFPLKDMASSIRSINQNTVENEMTISSKTGSLLVETPLDKLLNRAKADILVELSWKINKIGPKNSVTYTLRGIDTYTNKQIAATQGTGPQTFSAEIPILLEEAVIEHMDNFTAQLQKHFDDLLINGREITLSIKMFDNGSGKTFEDEFDNNELSEIIDNWIAQNTVNHRYNLMDATESVMNFEQVRIPLYRPNGMPMDTRHFATELRKFLSSTPYQLKAKVLTKGLGHADLILE